VSKFELTEAQYLYFISNLLVKFSW